MRNGGEAQWLMDAIHPIQTLILPTIRTEIVKVTRLSHYIFQTKADTSGVKNHWKYLSLRKK